MTQTKAILFVAGLSLSTLAYAGDAEVRADAANRTSFSAAAGGGWEKGAFFVSDGGNNTLHAGGTTQFRYNMSFRDEDSAGSQDDFTHGFNMPTERIRFWGTIWDKNFHYKIEGNFSDENPGGGTFALEDAFGMYDFGNGFAVKWGQQKLPLNRADIVDNEYQLSADRSIASAVFSGGYVQGIEGIYTSDQVKVSFGFHDGTFSQNTDFTSGSEADYALNARVDVQAMGTDWSRWNDYTSWKSAADNALLIGAAFNWQSGGETGFTTDVDVMNATIDISYESKGWHVEAAGYWAHVDPGTADFDNFGFEIGGGFFFNDQLEGFARWDGVFLDDDAFGGDTDMNFLTAGVNYYVSPESHAAKFTGQVSYAFNETDNIFGSGGLVSNPSRYGYLGQTDDGEFCVTLQMQIVF